VVDFKPSLTSELTLGLYEVDSLNLPMEMHIVLTVVAHVQRSDPLFYEGLLHDGQNSHGKKVLALHLYEEGKKPFTETITTRNPLISDGTF
jgi:hypothetical protein